MSDGAPPKSIALERFAFRPFGAEHRVAKCGNGRPLAADAWQAQLLQSQHLILFT